MKRLALLVLAGASVPLAAAWGTASQETANMPGVQNPAQARIDWMLKCQGCHRPDGGGDMASTPPLKETVARFLHVKGGREFLGRVPGVAMADLDDRRLAQLLNWTVQRFDAEHIPAGFRPYTEAEIGALRREPLRLEIMQMRAELIARMGDD